MKNHPDHTESVDYSDLTLLEEQLRSFAMRRRYWSKRPPDDLHTFSNDSGETLSFSDASYLDHEVVDIPHGANATREAPRSKAGVSQTESGPA